VKKEKYKYNVLTKEPDILSALKGDGSFKAGMMPV